MTTIWRRSILLLGATVALAACASAPRITTVQELSESADAPYQTLLVIGLFSSFDVRRFFEDEVVRQLSENGTKAVASTSMMNTKTPVTRQTFLSQSESINADAVLITQLVSLESTATVKDMRPESTYNIRPTYYYNVWSVEFTEYVEPQGLEMDHTLDMVTQVYSVVDRDAVWGIESNSNINHGFDKRGDPSFIVDEANAIVTHLARDGLIAK